MRKIFSSLIFISFFLPSMTFAMPYRGTEIVFSAANSYAVQTGQKVAGLGGNVVDVAVAIAFSMSVTNPTYAALGGGGFALVRMGKNTTALDFRERSPQATHPGYFLNKKNDASITGGAAVAVPGLPAGLYELHKKFGKLPWSRLLDDAIVLANKGFRVSGDLYTDTLNNKSRFNLASRMQFLKNTTTPYRPGEILVQKKLGRALSEMRNRNITSFYKGAIGKDIVDAVIAAGGEMTTKDLADYRVVWRDPIVTEASGYKLYLMPPPSSGGLLIQAGLKLIEKVKPHSHPSLSVPEFHLLTEVIKRIFSRREHIADPDYHKVPVDNIVGAAAINDMAKTIQLDEATDVVAHEVVSSEKSETTHISVLDKYGNAVAMTITLNGDYGSGVATEKYGIVLNNEMDDFTTRPLEGNMFNLVQGQGNSISPGKRPLSSMSPTLVEKDNKVVMAIGAPGGPRIISSVLQVLYRTLIRKTPLEAAIEAPRVHHQVSPNKVFIDSHRFAAESLDGLRQRKHILEESWPGRIYAVRNVDGILEGVVDTRGEGTSGGF